MLPSRPEFVTSAVFASRIVFSCASIASAMAWRMEFFSWVETSASLEAAARARSNLSCVPAEMVRLAINGPPVVENRSRSCAPVLR